MHSKEVLIEVKNVSLEFPRFLGDETTLKDLFISLLKNPFKKRRQPGFVALKNVDALFYRGQRVGIIGLNGASKTTFCRCLSDYYQPQKGTIKKYGTVRAIYDSNLALYPELSGRENLEIMAKIFYENEDSKAIVEESIGFSELGKFIDMPVKTYSKGMLLRLSMSILSARPADILILDEVFDGADEFFKLKLSARIKKLIDESGLVIFVSHEEGQVRTVCNSLIVMERGRITFQGNVDEGYDFYRLKG